MKVQRLVSGEEFDVVAVVDGERCPALDFISRGEAATRGSRQGLADILERIADHGLQNMPVSLIHEASKSEKIYEIRKGRLRLFFFHGEGRQIAVCTSGGMKKSDKADQALVNKAASWRKRYLHAIETKTLEVING